MFSKKCGALRLTPSIRVTPGVFSNDGVREASQLPISGRMKPLMPLHFDR